MTGSQMPHSPLGSGGGQGPIHPQDMRNLMIFVALSLLLYVGYNVFVVQPQSHAIRQNLVVQKSRTPIPDELPVKPRTREVILSDTPRISFENPEISGSIALRGGRIDDVSFKNYYETRERINPVHLFSPPGTEFARYTQTGWISADKNLDLPSQQTLWEIGKNKTLTPDHPVELSWKNSQGIVFARRLTIDPNFVISITDRIENKTTKDINVHPYALAAQTGLPPFLQNIWVVHEGPIGFVGKKLFQEKYNSLQDKPLVTETAETGWLGITDKYWLTALVPPQGQPTEFRFIYTPNSKSEPHNAKKDLGIYQVDYTGPQTLVQAGEVFENTTHVFAGAKKVLMLKEYEDKLSAPNFDLAVDFGWFWFLSKPFFYALHYLGLWIGNFGIAIICLTILIRSFVFPLTNASYKSFAKMKKVTPQVVALRETYGDDKKRMQEELVKMYQREGVNPMAGCIPMFLQIPIFFALYKVLVVTIEMRHAPFFGWIQDLSAPDPTSLLNLFGLIPWDPPAALDIGVWPCLMLVMMLIQKQLNPPPQDPIQRDLNTYFPFIITYSMAHFAAGLVIYWTFSALITILQQIIIMRSLNVPIYLFGGEPNEKKLDQTLNDGPVVHPLIEMAERQAEEALFGSPQEEPDAPSSKTISAPKRRKKKK
jgi:YidC/Oxa1 family membrane protein insertase